MRRITWSIEKNRQLKAQPERGVCFEDIVAAIEVGGLLADIEHPNPEKYPHQGMLVVLHNGYVYGVPYVPTEDGIFLKTAFPSRRLTSIYLSGTNNDPGT